MERTMEDKVEGTTEVKVSFHPTNHLLTTLDSRCMQFHTSCILSSRIHEKQESMKSHSHHDLMIFHDPEVFSLLYELSLRLVI